MFQRNKALPIAAALPLLSRSHIALSAIATVIIALAASAAATEGESRETPDGNLDLVDDGAAGMDVVAENSDDTLYYTTRIPLQSPSGVSADTFIDQQYPAANNGSEVYMYVRSYDGAGAGDDWEFSSLVAFDLSSIPSGASIISASLKLYYYGYSDSDPAGRVLRSYRITSAWDESTVTWNTRPSWNGTQTSQAIVPASPGWMSWDVKSDVEDIVAGGANHGWIIRDVNPWNAPNIPWARFRTKEFGQYKPYLKVVWCQGIPADADTFIDQQYPAANNGSEVYMYVRSYDGAGAGDDWEFSSLVAFDLSSIPSGASIISASLKLYYYGYSDSDPAGRILRSYRVTSAWNESTVTWSTRPSWNGTQTSQAIVPAGPGWMRWDVKSDVKDIVAGGANHGWIIRDVNPWNAPNIPWARFRTKEFGTYVPQLDVVWSYPTPTLSPWVLLLLLGTLLALGMIPIAKRSGWRETAR